MPGAGGPERARIRECSRRSKLSTAIGKQAAFLLFAFVLYLTCWQACWQCRAGNAVLAAKPDCTTQLGSIATPGGKSRRKTKSPSDVLRPHILLEKKYFKKIPAK